MQPIPRNPQSEEEQWLICPICKQPNPADVLHCQHCWGASLHSAKPISSAELARVMQRRQAYLKRLNVIKIVAVSLVAPLMLFSVVFFILYLFTDVVSSPLATQSSSPLPGEWTMFRRDLGHSGSIGPIGTPPEGKLKWSFSTGAAIHSSPAVVDGIVYIGSTDYKLYALDADTGAKLWEFPTGSWVESSPTVANGVVYFGSNDGKLYALDAQTGEKLWHFTTRYPIKSSPALADGIIYFGGTDGHIYALDAVTGGKLWDDEVRGWITSSPAVANGIVYAGSTDRSLYAWHALSGRFRLRFRPYSAVGSSPAVSNGVAYFNSSDGYLYAIDGKARNWPGEHGLRGLWIQFYAFRLAPPPPPISGFLWRLELGELSYSSPAIADDTIYTSVDNRLYRIDLEKINSGEIGELDTLEGLIDYFQSVPGYWIFSAEDDIRSSPAVANNAIYIGSDDGRLYAVNATSGEKIWDFLTGGEITSSPTLAGSTVYVGSYDGKVYAIE